jgi:hypothetical protein
MKSGVPQGSILGPLLFAIFVNDFALLADKCSKSLYADDMKLKKTIKSEIDCIQLQKTIDLLQSWCVNNGMLLNANKCKVISFHRSKANKIYFDYSIGGVLLDRVTHIRDLGVILDSKMELKLHYDRVVSSGFCVLGFIKRRVKDLGDPYIIKTLYCSLVLPILEYASVVWAPYRAVDSKRIESVQKQFLLFALRSLGFTGFRIPSYESRLLLLEMTTLANRRELASALFAFDLLRCNLDVESVASRIRLVSSNVNTRSNSVLQREGHRVDYARYDPVARAISNLNKFGEFYNDDVTKETFKNKIMTKFRTLCENPTRPYEPR